MENIKNNPFDICIYRNKCPDGMAAFWCIKKWGANRNIIGLPMYHTNTPDKDILKNKKVIFVDICLNREKMNDVLEYCTDVVVVDHHIESYELLCDLIKKDEPRFDLIYRDDKSTCQIMWDILSPTKTKGEPSFIKYIGTRDLGKGWGEKSHNFCLGWRDKFHTITYGSIDILYQSYITRTDFIDNIISKGEKIFDDILKKYDKLDRENGFFINKFKHDKLTYKVRICEGHELDKNDFAIYLCKKYKDIDFAVVWSEIKENNNYLNVRHKISMRSIKDNINLIPIAKSLGGGGHSNACEVANINVFNTFYNHNITDIVPYTTSKKKDNRFWLKAGICIIIVGAVYFLLKK